MSIVGNRVEKEKNIINKEICSNLKWYVITTANKKENIVMSRIQKAVINRGMQNMIVDTACPEEEEIERKPTGIKVKKTKLYPGYVFVLMELNEDTYSLIRSISGVTSILTKGSFLTEEEVRKVLRLNKDNKPMKKPKIEVIVGQTILIKEGPMSGIEGIIKNIDYTGKLVVEVEMFGRETIVNLMHTQIEPLNY